ncbi:MAG: hypothetical protein OEV53_16180 [Nitrospira sp.]|nr:hypothetical protein [Nitrospira sp.]MDH5195484.1 hypothetical protein [Nitrospira sp.]
MGLARKQHLLLIGLLWNVDRELAARGFSRLDRYGLAPKTGSILGLKDSCLSAREVVDGWDESASQSMKSQADNLLPRMAMFKMELSESEKAATPAIASVREHAARSIERAYGPERQPDRPRPPASRTKAPTRHLAVVGKDGRSGPNGSFEEF